MYNLQGYLFGGEISHESIKYDYVAGVGLSWNSSFIISLRLRNKQRLLSVLAWFLLIEVPFSHIVNTQMEIIIH